MPRVFPDISLKVICNGIYSDTLTVDIGVPQGSILGPFLYLLFDNDMGNFIHNGSFIYHRKFSKRSKQ